MIDANTKNTLTLRRRFCSHVKEWKDFYELLFVMVALFISLLSVWFSRETTKTAADSLRIQQKEFNIRNRPFVIARSVGFGNGGESPDGRRFDHSLVLSLENIAETPANNVRVESIHLLNGTEVWRSVIEEGALAKDKPMSSGMLLEELLYHQMTNAMNKTLIKTSVNYSGILSESQGEYFTTLEIHYLPGTGEFNVSRTRYR